ncbi:hypothetical protein NBRC110019_03500 [Neptunitalea chrysea]|uniref:Phosphoglyceromutase n=1 Tax=Neptunitalea chrysea TaxID=1647581 RepID=A0A9W6B2X1_9FLAO|nr:alkaline phosphatase family protein [Neptunitalea chrysea]GLB51311.1 hypothetical protein NBRC110019_03500 [Neptunitalea chrysea]
MKKLVTVLLLMVVTMVQAQKEQTKVILITLDGLRWQELFTGADSLLVGNKEFVEHPDELKELFWRPTALERRETLFPFIWKEVATFGQIHGNRAYGSKMNLTNTMWFSYPGYNEILTGKADDKNIHSNDKIYNPNVTVLEEVNNIKSFKGKVAAFGSWDVFPFIINQKRSGIPVNAGFMKAESENLTEREVFLNELQDEIPGPWGSVRLDAFTHHFAKEYLQKNHPVLTYISYGETDDFAHDGEYDSYLKSAHRTDAFIKELWNYTQNDPFYKGQTVFIITTDHGRGADPLDTWKHHGDKIKGSGNTWLIMFGSGIDTKGEVKTEEQLYTTMIAPKVKSYFIR